MTRILERHEKAEKGTKEVLGYDTGHELNDPRALVDRAAWLRKRVGLGAVEVGKGGKE